MEMLITQALDERDLLVKKINDAINGQMFMTAKRKNKNTDLTNVPVEKITADISSTYQSVNDMIKRYCMIIQKIAESNAVTKITVNDQEMTISAAISILKDIKNGTYFEAKLLRKLESDYDTVSKMVKKNNDTAEINRNNLLEKLMSRNDSKTPTEEDINVVNAMIDKDYAEVVDPLDLANKIKDLKAKTSEFQARILSAIKVSNATTLINID